MTLILLSVGRYTSCSVVESSNWNSFFLWLMNNTIQNGTGTPFPPRSRIVMVLLAWWNARWVIVHCYPVCTEGRLKDPYHWIHGLLLLKSSSVVFGHGCVKSSYEFLCMLELPRTLYERVRTFNSCVRMFSALSRNGNGNGDGATASNTLSKYKSVIFSGWMFTDHFEHPIPSTLSKPNYLA